MSKTYTFKATGPDGSFRVAATGEPGDGYHLTVWSGSWSTRIAGPVHVRSLDGVRDVVGRISSNGAIVVDALQEISLEQAWERQRGVAA